MMEEYEMKQKKIFDKVMKIFAVMVFILSMCFSQKYANYNSGRRGRKMGKPPGAESSFIYKCCLGAAFRHQKIKNTP